MFNFIRSLYNGHAAGFAYLIFGFSGSILLGLASTRISGRLDELAGYDVLEYSLRALIYGGLASLLGLCTLAFLVMISLGVLRYFRNQRGAFAWVLVILALLHLPISLLTLLVYGFCVAEVGGAVFRYWIG